MSEYITDMESGRPGFMLEGLNTEPATANINTVIFRGSQSRLPEVVRG